MHKDEILKYIDSKKNYIRNDYKLQFIFEILYLPENRELYKKKLYSLERKLDEPVMGHTPYKMKNFLSKSLRNSCKTHHDAGIKIIHSAGLLNGFSQADFGFFDTAYSDETKEEKSDDFVMAFEKLISDLEAIPSNSVIILSQAQHHMDKLKRKADVSFTVSEKRRKIAADSKGQKTITDYFKSTKSTTNRTQKPDEPVYKLEEIIQNKRGSDSNIKLLWIPKGSDELDPISYISVFFCQQVAQLIENDEIETKEACRQVLDTLPNNMWQEIVSYIEKLELEYENEFGEKENKVASNDTDEETC